LEGHPWHDDSDTEREPKTGKMKDQIIILERIVEQMTDALCQHGEKVDQMETEMGKMKHGFNEVIQECQSTADVMTDTLTNDIQDRLKASGGCTCHSHTEVEGPR
jgi:hypothetical protein